MLNLILDKLANEWRDDIQNKGLSIAGSATATIINGGRGKNRKVVCLVFSQDSMKPLLTIKISRTHLYNEKLLHEYHALETLWDAFSHLKTYVPQPIGLYEVGDNQILIERAISGDSLARLLRLHKRTRKKHVTEDINKSFDWLINLQKTMPNFYKELNISEELRVRLHQLSEVYSIKLPSHFVDGLLEMAENCGVLSIPFVASHGDFYPGNIFIYDDQVGVIDWEDFKPADWPFNDFFHYMIMFSQIYPWTYWKSDKRLIGFERAFFSRNWYSKLLLDYSRNFFSYWGIPLEFAHLFFSLFLLDKSTPKLEHGPKRLQQADMWRKRLIWYVERAQHSIYNF